MRLAYALTIGALLAGSAASLAADSAQEVAQAGSGAQTSAQPERLTPATESGPRNAPAAMAATPPGGAPQSFADLADQLQPAVVNISTSQRVAVGRTRNPGAGTPMEELFRRFQPPAPRGDDGEPVTRNATSLGSGFIVSADGYIVTNNHVVTGRNQDDPVDSITVTLSDGREFKAKLIGRDPPTDLALLKINASGLPYVRIGQGEKVRVGDWVLAIGNPFNLGGTVTAGIVSALHRDIGGQYDRYIQTDASINFGNSGGPLFDLRGNVVGVNTVILSPTGGNIGLGFAIPADVVGPVVTQLRSAGKVTRGYLGVGIQPVNDDIARSLGLQKNRGEIVASVEPSGPAAKSGIRQGDVIVRVAGEEVTDDNRLSPLIAKQKIGSTVPVEVIRGGKRETINVRIAERPTEQQIAGDLGADEDEDKLASAAGDQTQATRRSLGVTLQALTPQIRQQLRVPADTQGVVIVGLNPSSDAAEKGLRRGDIIRSINQQPVKSPAEAAAAVEAAKKSGRNAVLLLVQRGTNPPTFLGVDLVAQRSAGG